MLKLTESNILPLVSLLLGVMVLMCPYSAMGEDDVRDDGHGPLIAVKSNLAHDALLTPDLGVELSFGRRFSVSVEGVYAWWSRDSAHRYWRIRGSVAEMRVWLGRQVPRRALTGFHFGVYGSMHDFDFEFGGKGWQSPGITFGLGLGYGYSLRLSDRLNLDLGLRIGYSGGKVTEYKPQCGAYVCTDNYYRRHFGLQGVDVTLVWFPGRNNRNNPDYIQ